jgi:hypothetical protein
MRPLPTLLPWDAAIGTGTVRLGVGAGLARLARPLAQLAGARVEDRVTPAVLRGFGIRDMTLGVAALAASRPGGDVAAQLRLQAAFDAVDASVCGWLVYTGRLPRIRGAACAGTAVVSGILEIAMSRRLASYSAGTPTLGFERGQ